MSATPASPAAPARSPLLAGLLMATSAAFVLAGYELLRTPTNTLFVAAYGKERLPAVTALIPVAVALVTYLYMRLLSWLGPRRTLFVTSLSSVVLVALGRVALATGQSYALWPLFLLREAYVVLLIEQYWSFINSIYTQAEARRLNGPICGFASLGSILGGVVGAQLAETVGTTNMILLAAVVTVPAAFISDLGFRLFGEPKPSPAEAAHLRRGHGLGLGVFKTERVLPLLLAVVTSTQVIATVLGLAFQGVLQDRIPSLDQQSAYSYAFFAWVNGGAAVMQFVAAPLLMHAMPPVLLHLLIPLVHVVTCAFYLHAPGLTTIAVAYGAFKAVDYSLFRAAKEVLYIPLSFAGRYRAKEVIDVLGYRVSKGVTSGLVSLLQEAGLVFGEGTYAGIALVTAVLWAGLTVPLGRHYREKTKELEAAA